MKNSFLIIIIFIFLIVTLPLRTLDTWMPTDIRLDTGDNPGANHSYFCEIFCVNDKVFVVWEDERNGSNDIYFNYSVNNGENWQSSDIRLDTGDAPGANVSKRPQINCFENNVFVVWHDARNGSSDIYFNYSTDSGANWLSSAIRLDTGDTAGANNSWNPQISCSDNFVYVVWYDYRNSTNDGDIYFNYSTDNGINWQVSDIRLDTGDAPGANRSYSPQIACYGVNVYVVWYDERNGNYDIYFNYSNDYGANWQSTDIRLDTGDPPGAKASKRPQITCSGNNVYVVWEDSRDYNIDIYFNYSTNAGVNWQSSAIRLDTGDPPGASKSHIPAITCSGNNVYVVWEDERDGYHDIYCNYSNDGGANWQSSDIRLDTGDIAGANYSFGPQIACSGTKVYVVWQDERNGNFDIYFNKAILWADVKANGSDGPISITQSDTLQIRISLNTNGITDNADFWLAYKTASGWYHFNNSTKSWDPGLGVTHQGILFDLNNKKVFQSSGLSLGTYRFYFGVDLNMNGTITKSCLFYDMVKVTVTND